MPFNFQEDIELSNERAQLRPLALEDLEHLLLPATQYRDLNQFSPSQINSRELLNNYILQAINDRLAGRRYPWIIYDKEKKLYAGCTSLFQLSEKDKRVEIGATWIGKNFQGTGLNRSVKNLLLDYLFGVLHMERVELKTDERNLQSRRAIEKLGGVYEGTFRSHTVMSDGFRRNTVYFSILRSEWAISKGG